MLGPPLFEILPPPALPAILLQNSENKRAADAEILQVTGDCNTNALGQYWALPPPLTSSHFLSPVGGTWCDRTKTSCL